MIRGYLHISIDAGPIPDVFLRNPQHSSGIKVSTGSVHVHHVLFCCVRVAAMATRMQLELSLMSKSMYHK